MDAYGPLQVILDKKQNWTSFWTGKWMAKAWHHRTAQGIIPTKKTWQCICHWSWLRYLRYLLFFGESLRDAWCNYHEQVYFGCKDTRPEQVVFGCLGDGFRTSRKGAQQKPVGAMSFSAPKSVCRLPRPENQQLDPPKSRIIESFPRSSR